MARINIVSYKQDLMKFIAWSDSIEELIDSRHFVDSKGNPIFHYPEDLINHNIFPFFLIPDVQTDADCYVLFAVDVVGINRSNSTYANYRVTVRCLCHKARMMVEGKNATRIDLLGDKIKELLDGQQMLGMSEFELRSNQEYILNENYQYRDLIFTCQDQRHPACQKR